MSQNLQQLQQFFSSEAAAQMGQAVGLDAQLAHKALSVGLPLQLGLLREHVASPQGQQNILEAVRSLPHFSSVAEALKGNDSAAHLQSAGEMVYAELFPGQADQISHVVTRQVGGSVGGIQKLLNMSLPLLLSALGRLGLNAGNLSAFMNSLDPAQWGNSVTAASFNPAVAAGLTGASTAAAATAAAGTPDFLSWVRAQFAAQNAEKIGQAAGFNNSTAVRAVQGVVPVILNALIHKGNTEAGAAELKTLAAPFTNLTTEQGLNTTMLGDSAEMTRLEGQGRGLLAGLFSNTDELIGRLGTALGGSGSSAGRLLALVTPLLLSGLSRHSEKTEGGLSGLLKGLGGKLNDLVPAGLPIAPLLAAPVTATTIAAKPEVKKEVAVPPAPKEEVKVAAAPVVTETVKEVVVTKQGSSFPWWLIPLALLLLLGGYWMFKKPAPTATPVVVSEGTRPAAAGSIVVENPQAGANLPPAPFTMSGTASPNDTLTIEDEGQEVVKAEVDEHGKWSAEIPAPTVGEHTYRLMGTATDTKSEFKVNVVEATEGHVDVPFEILEPASGTEVNTDGFNITGRAPAGIYELFEDGVSVGTFTVEDDGKFTVDVAAPTEGEHHYDFIGKDGNHYHTLPLTVLAAAVDTACADPLTLSLNDGEEVSAPFRFGGHGSGKGVTVNVWRGDRQVGTQEVVISPTCTWSYKSDPGGQADLMGDVRYEVIPQNAEGEADASAQQSVNLKVSGSGTNFNEKGEYVGPKH